MTSRNELWPGFGFNEVVHHPSVRISRFLSDDGTTTGGKNANANGSGTPVPFWFEDSMDCHLTRIICYVRDTGAITAGGYGNLPALTNGVLIQITDADDVVQLDLLDGEPIVSYGNWVALCHDGSNHSFGSGDNAFSARWTFRAYGGPLLLPAGWKLRAVVQDNCTGLVRHSFHVSGARAISSHL